MEPIKFIDLGSQYRNIRAEVLAAIDEISCRGAYILGDEVQRFEQEFAQYCGTKHALGVANGTDALFLVMKALGIGPEDEIITAANSFIATAGAIVAAGAKPVMVDVRDDYNIDPFLVEKAITPKTKAIIPVHLTGRPANMGALMAIAQRHNLHLIEDAAQAVGAAYRGQRVGSFGIAGCFSLHPLKNLHVQGDGGVITTNDTALYEQILKLRNHGLRNRDECEFFGHNSRLDTIQAAIASLKLKYLDQWTSRIRSLAAKYQQELSGIVQVPRDAEKEFAVYHRFIIQCTMREELQRFLQEQGIETKVHYPIPIHLQPAARKLGHKLGDFPVAERQAQRILSLPLYPELTEAQIDRVIAAIRSFYQTRGDTTTGTTIGNTAPTAKEVNLLEKYPRAQRKIEERATQRTPEDVAIAKQFGQEFFDGDRRRGYGGYYYHPRFWTEVVKDFIAFYGLTNESKILDIGCGKGFMLYDFKKALPGMTVQGVDISEYAITHGMPEVRPYLHVGNAKDLSRYKDKEFDLVISINTIHNLSLPECKEALREIQRVGKRAFIINDAWRNDEEKQRMLMWNLTAETYMHVDDWKRLFQEVGYTGEYYWFIAE